MNSQTVRAVLAYSMTALLLICLVLVAFVPMSQIQMAMAGTVIGAIIANAKVPLAYFYDGVATPEQDAAPDAPVFSPDPNDGAETVNPDQLAKPAPAKAAPPAK